MDNVTHALAGALIAEAALAAFARARPEIARIRGVAFVTSILSNNLPDFDFLYRRITPGKIGYLLHHRGHTHTVPGALVLGALALAGTLGWLRIRRISFSRRELGILAGLAFAGPFVHVALDFGNNYGVHPFWPLNDGWYYGDSVFIVEPLLWAVAIPPLVFSSTSRLSRALMGGLFIAGTWIAGRRVLSWTEVVAVFGVAGVFALTSAMVPDDRRGHVGIAGWLLVTAAFAAESHAAKARALSASRAQFPTTRVVDIVATPRPANPFCWSALVVGVDGDVYVARRARVTTAFWPASCTTLDGTTSTAPLRAISVRDGDVRFDRELAEPVRELRDLAKRNCTVAAFLRYSRVPFVAREGTALVVGDLRFDRSRAHDFTDLDVPNGGAGCPRHVPPWRPPRADLFE